MYPLGESRAKAFVTQSLFVFVACPFLACNSWVNGKDFVIREKALRCCVVLASFLMGDFSVTNNSIFQCSMRYGVRLGYLNQILL